jgi:hypothetical protein
VSILLSVTHNWSHSDSNTLHSSLNWQRVVHTFVCVTHNWLHSDSNTLHSSLNWQRIRVMVLNIWQLFSVVSFLFNWSVPTLYVECTNQNVLKQPMNNSWLQWFLYQFVWVQIPLRCGVLDTSLCDQVCQWLVTGQWFSPRTSVHSTNKTDHHDITEILLKVALN